MRTVVERRIRYEYGPKAPGYAPFEGVFAGEYTWEELYSWIEDEMWGAPYRVVRKEERTVTYGDWEALDE